MRGFGFLLSILVILPNLRRCLDVAAPKIGIVGAGIGGTASAQFLRDLFGKDGCELWLFEQSEEVGGRMATTKMAGHTYEIGGTQIHSTNRYMAELVERTGLERRPAGPKLQMSIRSGPKDDVALFKEYTSFGPLNTLLLAYRYGFLNLLKVRNQVTAEQDNFSRLYPYLEDGKQWETVMEMAKFLSPDVDGNHILNMTSVSLAELYTTSLGVGGKLVDELCAAAVRTNYGQVPSEIHAYAGSIAMAGCLGDLWAINGGNHKLAERLVQHSDAKLVKGKVRSITLLEDGRYQLTFAKDDDTIGHEVFDVVILATPQTEDKHPLEFVNLTVPSFPGRYHRTVATLVEGRPSPDFFVDVSSKVQLFVNAWINVNAVAKQFPAALSAESFPAAAAAAEEDFPEVYKVFSQEPLSERELDEMFVDRNGSEAVDWLAYPHYDFRQGSLVWGRFVLNENLYYTSTVEWLGSTMECSAIAAKNVANLAFSKWTNNNNRLERKAGSKDQLKMEL